MKIEFVEATEETDTWGTEYKIKIDGVVDTQSNFSHGILFLNKTETIQKILQLSSVELGKLVNEVHFSVKKVFNESEVYGGIHFSDLKDDQIKNEVEAPFMKFNVSTDADNWKYPYSINTFREIYKKAIEDCEGVDYENVHYYRDSSEIAGIILKIDNTENPLQIYFDKFGNLFSNISIKVQRELIDYFPNDIFTTTFEFPEELKISCKQYLIYFAQFLADIGIKADTSFKEDVNKVLFTVTPADGEVALEKIRDALEIYMNAPANPEINIVSDSPKDIALIQWEANIYHLKSQLALQQAILQAKDATIEALQLSNYRLKEEITSTTKNNEQRTLEFKDEKVMGGVVTIKKYEGKGFSIDLPSLIRKLKRKK